MQTTLLPGYCESFGTFRATFRFIKNGLVKTEDLQITSTSPHILFKVTDFSIGYQDFNGTYNVDCFDTYNASNPLYSDLSVDNTYDRQWDWFLCSGFGW
jgi:hypothetical protein